MTKQQLSDLEVEAAILNAPNSWEAMAEAAARQERDLESIMSALTAAPWELLRATCVEVRLSA